MEVNGTIKLINQEQQVSISFKKRELVVTTAEQYPQHILIEFAQDKCDLLNNYKIGDEVSISINLRGREWVNQQGETKYFNQIQGWKILAIAETTNSANNATVNGAEVVTQTANDSEDNLPF